MIRQWYIGFIGDHSGRRRGWFDLFTCKHFRHVVAMGYDPHARAWAVFDPSYRITDIRVLKNNHPDIAALIGAGIWLSWPDEKRKAVRTFGLTWCVPAVKRLIGFRSSALRPRGLYIDLLKHGASHAFRDTYSSQSHD